MQHIHFQECSSTQNYFLEKRSELLEKNANTLISTSSQPEGVGRREKTWIQRENSLAFSFNITPNSVPSLTSLEVGILISKYLSSLHSISLFVKWPNDLLDFTGKKLGGIICHMQGPNSIIVGVGINYKSHLSKEYDYPIAEIETKLQDEQLKSYPRDIYQYILDNRLSNIEVVQSWNQFHFYQNKEVKITDLNHAVCGEFIGINEQGVALVKDQAGRIHKVATGSLSAV